MSDDVIKREDAIGAINGWLKQNGFSNLGGGILHLVPSADRPQGEWSIEKTCYDNYNYRCSYCDWYETHAYPDVEPYNFCPNCGARMKGADDE